MNRLWAPWRIAYILDPKEDGCFLCRILREAEDARNLVVERAGTCALLMNRYPYNGGHLMVAPFRHLETTQDMNEAELLDFMRLTNRGMDLLRKVTGPDGFNVGINLGEAAGAGLKDHVHLHIVPRWNGDTNFMPVMADLKVIPQALEELWTRLRNAATTRPAI